jgi:hypothetical protein
VVNVTTPTRVPARLTALLAVFSLLVGVGALWSTTQVDPQDLATRITAIAMGVFLIVLSIALVVAHWLYLRGPSQNSEPYYDLDDEGGMG